MKINKSMLNKIELNIKNNEDFEDSENFEKWKEEFAMKNGFYIPCIHDKYYYEKLRKENMKMEKIVE